MTPRHVILAPVLALATALALGACDRRAPDDADPNTTIDPQADAAPDGPPALEPPAMPAMGDPTAATQASEIRVTGLSFGNRMGEGNRVASEMTTFAPGDTIHASVRTDGDGGGLSARWLFEDGQVVHTEDAKVPAGPQVTAFRVDNAEGWPTGTYTVEVMVDGQVMRTGEFEVRPQ